MSKERTDWETRFDEEFHTPNAGTAWGDMSDVKQFIREILSERDAGYAESSHEKFLEGFLAGKKQGAREALEEMRKAIEGMLDEERKAKLKIVREAKNGSYLEKLNRHEARSILELKWKILALLKDPT